MPAITSVIATKSKVDVFFSDPMQTGLPGPPATPSWANAANNGGNYTLYYISGGAPASQVPTGAAIDQTGTVVTLTLAIDLTVNGWVMVVAQNINTAAGVAIPVDGVQNVASARVDGVSKNFPGAVAGALGGGGAIAGALGAGGAIAGAVNAPAFPILTEEMGYPPSPLARPGGTTGGAGGGTALAQIVSQTVNGVLGWKAKTDDPKAFIGALNASFTSAEVDGHTKLTWQQRTYAIQSDLGAGITGAQASLYSRAQDALNQAVPLLDGLYPLNPAADEEDVTAYREVVRTQLTQLVNEFAFPSGPRVYRVDQYFGLLLGNAQVTVPPPNTPVPPWGPIIYTPYRPGMPGGIALPQLAAVLTSPPPGTSSSDLIDGSLGNLRDLYAIYTTPPTPRTAIPPGAIGPPYSNQYINSVADEQDTANFRIISDYVTSLGLTWINNYQFFGLQSTQVFFGTQLVLISRQFTVVAEDVDEVRFALDSVFIGPDERQTLPVYFGPLAQPAANQVQLYLEDFLSWVQSFASDEGPQLLQQSGIYAAYQSVLSVATQLQGYVSGCQNNPLNNNLPAGFQTGRVQYTLNQLASDMQSLVNLLTNLPQPTIPPGP